MSHGSVRIAYEVVTGLARGVMAHGGAAKDDAWYEMAARNDSDQHIVELSNPIPLTIRE